MTDHIFEIILVEDNPHDAELTLRAFKKNNIANTIHLISDGEEALEYFYGTGKYAGRNMNFQPKLVILDLKMPKVDGIDILKKLKSDEKLRTIPVVVLTSSREECDILQSYNLGANSYLVKPVSIDKFSETIRDLGIYWLLLNEPLK